MLGADLACLDGRFGRSLRECQRRREESESRALEKASSRRGDHGKDCRQACELWECETSLDSGEVHAHRLS